MGISVEVFSPLSPLAQLKDESLISAVDVGAMRVRARMTFREPTLPGERIALRQVGAVLRVVGLIEAMSVYAIYGMTYEEVIYDLLYPHTCMARN